MKPFCLAFAVSLMTTPASGGDLSEAIDMSRSYPFDALPSSIDAAQSAITWDGTSVARAVEIANGVAPEVELVTRGARDVEIYRQASPSVVMVLTNESIGSGIMLSGAGQIVTNYHVVKGYETVGVIFKPVAEGDLPTENDIVRADLVAADPSRDLALLRPASVPSGRTPLILGTVDEVQVGADVYAIGHPTGEFWTYTKGIISQVRNGYEWSDEGGNVYHASVIQTQTPINPGNSGGPLISEAGLVIGINSFINPEAQGINYAISVLEIRTFLEGAKSGEFVPTKIEPANSCEWKSVSSKREPDVNDGVVDLVDVNCDGQGDLTFFVPDDPSIGIMLWIDSNDDGAVDAIVVDEGRDGCWDMSYYDVNFDGEPDVMGEHENCEIEAARLEPYTE